MSNAEILKRSMLLCDKTMQCIKQFGGIGLVMVAKELKVECVVMLLHPHQHGIDAIHRCAGHQAEDMELRHG